MRIVSENVTVSVPATSANLGPGFDCLALALDLWNRVEFHVCGTGICVEVNGQGREHLPKTAENLVVRAAARLLAHFDCPIPAGLLVRCENDIPAGSGLGSSATAVLAGLLGANALMGNPACREEILSLAGEMEGHVDNAAAALYGGLTVVATSDTGVIVRCYEIPQMQVAVILPDIELSTHAMRAALPEYVRMQDAVFKSGPHRVGG